MLDQSLQRRMSERAPGPEMPSPDPDLRLEPLRLAAAHAFQRRLVDRQGRQLLRPLHSGTGWRPQDRRPSELQLATAVPSQQRPWNSGLIDRSAKKDEFALDHVLGLKPIP